MTEYTIQRLGHHGDGVADGPIFVPLTLPGEVIAGAVTGNRIAEPKIITPSPDRVRPVCAHYRGCGGCAVQHASDTFVAGWKVQITRDALAAQGIEAPIRRVHSSPARSRRRATFSARRTKKSVLVGFHARASDTIIDTPDCQLVRSQILDQRPVIAALARAGGSRKTELSATVTWSEAGADLSVQGGKPLDTDLRLELTAIAQQYGLARLGWNGDLIIEANAPVQDFDGIRVVPPPGAFLQATAEGEAALRQSVLEAVEGAADVADLFAGCGTFALPLARNAQVHAVESDPQMLTALDAAWRYARNLKKVTTEPRDLFRRPLVPLDLKRFDAVVLDPPRAGAEAQCTQIAQSEVTRIAMVSCNPTSFARDARLLRDAGFCLNWVDVVDQFRWSPHVELAASFTR